MGFLRLLKSLSRKHAGAAPGRKSGPDRAMDDTSRTLDCSSRSDDGGPDPPLSDCSLSQDASSLDVSLEERLDVAHDASWDIQDIISGCDDDESPDVAPKWNIEDILCGRDDVARVPPGELPDHLWDVDLIVRRETSDRGRPSLSSTSSGSSRVSFVDEARGLTPRHVVTQTHYIPQTTAGEKRELYYTKKDFAMFQREELYEQIEEKIRLMENGSVDATDDATDDAEIRALMAKVQRLQ